MMRATDLGTPAASAAVILSAFLGGGFYPLPRMVVAGALMVVWVLAAAGFRGRPDRTEWLLAGTVAWGLIVAVWVGSSPLAGKETLTIWITALLLFGICRRGSGESRFRAIGILTVGAAVVAAAVIVEAIGSGLRVGGFFENPNLAAALLVPTLPMGWWVLEKRSRWRWAWSFLAVAGIVCSGSRAGLLAMIVAVALMLPRGGLLRLVLLAGSLLATSVLVVRFVSQPDALAWHRISIWRAVIRIWLTRPLTGVGPGSLVEAAGQARILHPDEIGRYQFVVGYSESTPLAVLVQLGIVGVVLVGLAVFTWWIAGRADSIVDRPIVVSAFSAAVVLGAFHDFLTIDPVLWWWAVLLGCSTSPPGARAEVSSVAGPFDVKWVAALLMVWLTAWGIATPAYARRTMASGSLDSDGVVRALRIEPWLSTAPAARVRSLLATDERWTWESAAEALHWAQTAVDVHPGLSRLWADLGRVHLRVLTDLGGTQYDGSAARQALTRACELDPHLAWNWLERARLEWLTGNLNEAVRLTNHALAQEPDAVRGWLLLSRLQLESGRREAAISALKNAEDRLGLAEQRGLSIYDLDLLHAPAAQLESLRHDLGQPPGGGS